MRDLRSEPSWKASVLHNSLSHDDIVVQMSCFSAISFGPDKGRFWQIWQNTSQLIQAGRQCVRRVMDIDELREKERDSSSPGYTWGWILRLIRFEKCLWNIWVHTVLSNYWIDSIEL